MTKPWKTLIIDDEELAGERLKRLLLEYSAEISIIAEASDADKAEVLIESLKPDLIFLDVKMPGKNVFEMLSSLHHKPFVVFCTAYDHYALKAFESNAVDYLVKPVEEHRLKATIEKLRKIENLSGNASLQSVLDAIHKIEIKATPTSIPHKIGDKTVLVKLEKVVFLEAEDKYVNFYDEKGTKYISDQSLKALEDRLPDNFLRVSKSTILNKHFVNEVHRYFRGKMVFVLEDIKRTKITSGSSYSERIRKEFDL